MYDRAPRGSASFDPLPCWPEMPIRWALSYSCCFPSFPLVGCPSDYPALTGGYTAMATHKLTAAFVEKIKPPPKDRLIYWDEAQPGFGVMLTAGGKRSWLCQYRSHG